MNEEKKQYIARPSFSLDRLIRHERASVTIAGAVCIAGGADHKTSLLAFQIDCVQIGGSGKNL